MVPFMFETRSALTTKVQSTRPFKYSPQARRHDVYDEYIRCIFSQINTDVLIAPYYGIPSAFMYLKYKRQYVREICISQKILISFYSIESNRIE